MRRCLLLLALTFSISAADQVRYLDFGQGPAQWLMTREEQRAWRSVKTEAQAREFADLFWARRDPSPGTPLNEFRGEVESRIKFADDKFKEPRKRGAMTERGRVLLVLGMPKNLGQEAEKRTAYFAAPGGGGGPDPTGGRAQAAREEWVYDYNASIKFGLPKILVVFIHDGSLGQVRRDPQRTDFSSAMPNAINHYLKNPQLTSVPDWAKSGIRVVEAAVRGAQVPSPAPPPVEVVVPFDQNPTGGTAVAPLSPPVIAKPAGAGRLTLVLDAFAIDPQAGRDPFSSLTNVSSFRRDSELGWAAEYCTGRAATDVETVSVALKVSGLINGERVNFHAPADDLAPDAIKRSPGCYVVRGGVPLSEMDPGNYTLTVSIAGLAGQGSYNLTREFKVE